MQEFSFVVFTQGEKTSVSHAIMEISHPSTAISSIRELRQKAHWNVDTDLGSGAHLRELWVLQQGQSSKTKSEMPKAKGGLEGPASWVTRLLLAVKPMVFPTRREAAIELSIA